MSVLEIVFVGQCEGFDSLDFVKKTISLGREAHSSLKNVNFSNTYPLKLKEKQS